MQARYKTLIEEGSADDAGVRLAALKHVLHDCEGYQPDPREHEILESADMIRVIDRRAGDSAALSILYIDMARKNNWQIEGLAFPDRLLCRIAHEGTHLIFDTSQNCKCLEAHELRSIVKDALGEAAELATEYYQGLGARECVVQLCNRIKLRHIESGAYDEALSIVERMRVIAPDEYRLLLDAGVLYARTHQVEKAVEALEDYIERAPNQYDREEARLLLSELHQGPL